MVEVKLNAYKYEIAFTLYEKITVIVGDSASGKTEFVRQFLESDIDTKVSVSEGFELSVLDRRMFEYLCKSVFRKKEVLDRTIHHNRISENEKKNILNHYWKEEDNHPFSYQVVICDDDDFTLSTEFAVLVSTCRTSYFIIMQRGRMSKLAFSIDQIYKINKDGRKHWLEKYYHFEQEDQRVFDEVVVEGTKSDFIYFQELFQDSGIPVTNPTTYGRIKNGGKSAVVSLFDLFHEQFERKRVFLIIDACGFGSEIGALFEKCKNIHSSMIIFSKYLSFEYMLLCSRLIQDEKLHEFIQEHSVDCENLERLFTERLKALTQNTNYLYAKSIESFPVCYYKDCCCKRKLTGSCKKRMEFAGKNKFVAMLQNTDFQYFLKMAGMI